MREGRPPRTSPRRPRGGGRAAKSPPRPIAAAGRPWTNSMTMKGEPALGLAAVVRLRDAGWRSRARIDRSRWNRSISASDNGPGLITLIATTWLKSPVSRLLRDRPIPSRRCRSGRRYGTRRSVRGGFLLGMVDAAPVPSAAIRSASRIAETRAIGAGSSVWPRNQVSREASPCWSIAARRTSARRSNSAVMRRSDCRARRRSARRTPTCQRRFTVASDRPVATATSGTSCPGIPQLLDQLHEGRVDRPQSDRRRNRAI